MAAWARAAARLHPDGARLPARRCLVRSPLCPLLLQADKYSWQHAVRDVTELQQWQPSCAGCSKSLPPDSECCCSG